MDKDSADARAMLSAFGPEQGLWPIVMRGFDSNYVPGLGLVMACQSNGRSKSSTASKGKNKDEVPINEFRQECREFADHWIGVQSEEFRRLGVEGDFVTPYKTMNFPAEAKIAGELLKFAKSGQLYRGSKPIMWSVMSSWDVPVVIWTTTPWTIPGNRAICYSPKINYGLYEVTSAEMEFGPQPGDKLIFADKLAQECFEKAKLEFKKLRDVKAAELGSVTCAHPLRGFNDAYAFDVPLLDGDHVTDDADDGSYTDEAPGFGDARVIDDKGKKGKANQEVITALIGQNNLFARGRVKHEYPHSWRSKKPIIFRNTPQWFVYMDKDGVIGDGSSSNMGTLRQTSLAAIDETRSDQHRGWFHSSLLEACGTRGRAPYDTVLTHGFVMAEDGTKMSKSKGNIVTPQEVIKQSGADILRLWVASSDYSEDLRLGKTILQTNIDAYRKMRNTLRWMLGTLSHYQGEEVAHDDMPGIGTADAASFVGTG
ncbi:Isoleucine--tRNA ligase [Nymphon striatum]|nr:Isoleucine--tRNA ligase [Nymphon striatum]